MGLYSPDPLRNAAICRQHDEWLNKGLPDDGPDGITEEEVRDLYKHINLADWDEREVTDNIDPPHCVESVYTYELPEGRFYVYAMDVLPDDYQAEILGVEFEADEDGQTFDLQ